MPFDKPTQAEPLLTQQELRSTAWPQLLKIGSSGSTWSRGAAHFSLPKLFEEKRQVRIGCSLLAIDHLSDLQAKQAGSTRLPRPPARHSAEQPSKLTRRAGMAQLQLSKCIRLSWLAINAWLQRRQQPVLGSFAKEEGGGSTARASVKHREHKKVYFTVLR